MKKLVALFTVVLAAPFLQGDGRQDSESVRDSEFKIVFVRHVLDKSSHIYSMNVDGTDQVRLTDDSARDHDPSVSSDGSKIVFARYLGNNHELYVMNADGTEQTRLTNSKESELDPVFSPDGSKIAYASSPSFFFWRHIHHER